MFSYVYRELVCHNGDQNLHLLTVPSDHVAFSSEGDYPAHLSTISVMGKGRYISADKAIEEGIAHLSAYDDRKCEPVGILGDKRVFEEGRPLFTWIE